MESMTGNESEQRLQELDELIQQAVFAEASGESLRNWRIQLTMHVLRHQHSYGELVTAKMPFYQLAKSLVRAEELSRAS